jgi:hypothetical protein
MSDTLEAQMKKFLRWFTRFPIYLCRRWHLHIGMKIERVSLKLNVTSSRKMSSTTYSFHSKYCARCLKILSSDSVPQHLFLQDVAVKIVV